MRKFLIKVNGNQYEVEVEEINSQGAQSASSRTAAPAGSAAEAAPAGTNVVTAPMPGTIVRVDVSVGDVVSKGQVLLVLEAMKMENEIVAPVAGKVTAINVTKGSTVNAGDVMVQLG